MSKRGSQEKLLLLYDGECGLCLRSVAAIRKLHVQAELRLLPLQQAKEEEIPPGTSRDQLLAELHVVDEAGRVYRGAEAVVRIMRTVPSLGWISILYRLPGLKGAADAIYRWIADHRYRVFGKTEICDSGSCKVHSGGAAGSAGTSIEFQDERSKKSDG